MPAKVQTFLSGLSIQDCVFFRLFQSFRLKVDGKYRGGNN